MLSKPHNRAVGAITESPHEAVAIGQAYFDSVNSAAQRQYGGVVVNSMLDAAQSLGRTDHQQAFTTTLQAVNLAQKTGDSDVLRVRGFEQAGAIISNYSVINEKTGAQMRQAAEATAAIHGPKYQEALRRGEANEKAGYQRDQTAAPQTATDPLPGATGATEAGGGNNGGGFDGGRPRQTPAGSDATSAAATTGRLSDVGDRPLAAPQQPGLARRVGRGVLTAAKWGVAGVALLAAAQHVSVWIGNDTSWPILGVRSVSDNFYRGIASEAGKLRAAEFSFGQVGPDSRIGMPRVVANMDQNPAAREGAIAIARQEGAEAERARLNEEDARKRGIIAPQAEDVSKRIDAWRKQHPREFGQVVTMAAEDVPTAMLELGKTAPPELARDMANLLATKGVIGFREPLFAAHERQLIEQRNRGAGARASGPTP